MGLRVRIVVHLKQVSDFDPRLVLMGLVYVDPAFRCLALLAEHVDPPVYVVDIEVDIAGITAVIRSFEDGLRQVERHVIRRQVFIGAQQDPAFVFPSFMQPQQVLLFREFDPVGFLVSLLRGRVAPDPDAALRGQFILRVAIEHPDLRGDIFLPGQDRLSPFRRDPDAGVVLFPAG